MVFLATWFSASIATAAWLGALAFAFGVVVVVEPFVGWGQALRRAGPLIVVYATVFIGAAFRSLPNEDACDDNGVPLSLWGLTLALAIIGSAWSTREAARAHGMVAAVYGATAFAAGILLFFLTLGWLMLGIHCLD